ncbi:tonsoku-like protein [Alca torda]
MLVQLLGSLPCHSLGCLELGSVAGSGHQPLAGAFGRYLVQEGCVLRHLTFSRNRLGDNDVLEVARCLPACPAQVSLDFSANPGISTVGLWALLSALEERSQGLQFLSLAGCSMAGPLDDRTGARAASKIRDLRLCSQHVRRSNQQDVGTTLGATAVTRHHELFCKSL